MSRLPVILIAALLLTLAPCAWALEPNQVVVLVNRNLDESVALGRFYCAKRHVPENNLVALSLPTTDDISPEEYDNLLVKPLRQALLERKLRDDVRCLLTIRGVPFRVLERPRDPNSQILLDWYQAAAARSAARFQEDLRLMELVTKPAPARVTSTGDLYDRSRWFDAPAPTTAPATADAADQERFWVLAKNKLLEIHHLGAGPEATLAHRQWLALAYDAFGLEGMPDAMRMASAQDNPPTSEIESRLKDQAGRIEMLVRATPTPKSLADLEVAFRAVKGAWGLNQQVSAQISNQNIATSRAAVDSELALLLWKPYNYDGYLRNPLFWQERKNRAAMEQAGGGRTLMVSRLDGPKVEYVMRMILDSIATEKTGLCGRLPGGGQMAGTFYIDAGASPNGASEYNQHFQSIADMVRRHTNIPVKVDNRPEVFEPNECPDTALYIGWYSLQKYVPAFTFVKGAVGFHVASWEAVHLRDPNCQEWVPQMIAHHVAATIGACDEPFLHAFPLAEDFFSLLLTGKVTIAEAYWRTVPHVSWRMMLLADPLYNPFAANPQTLPLPEGALPPSEQAPASSSAP
jgi:uncharacterized protein (TIGR03790 family)